MANENNADFTPSIPDASYTPNKPTYTNVGEFRFWAQKVLPTVYDDSLSYYEVLTKLVWHINKMIEDMDNFNLSIDSTNENFASLQSYVNEQKNTLISAYDELQGYVNDYFDSLDVQTEINNKLDTMASDGSLSRLIAPAVPDVITEWLAEHITPTSPAIDSSLTVSGAGADAKVTGDWFNELKKYNSYNYLKDITKTNTTFNGITYAWTGSSCHVSGTASANSWINLLYSTGFMFDDIKVGEKVYCNANITDPNIVLQLLFYNGSSVITILNIRGAISYPIPVNTTMVHVRIFVENGKTVNGDISEMVIMHSLSDQELSGYTESMVKANGFNYADFITKADTTFNGITYTWNGDVCTVAGTAGANSWCNLLYKNGYMFSGAKSGDTLYCSVDTSDPNIVFEILFYNNARQVLTILNVRGDISYVIPANTAMVSMRIFVANGATVNGTISGFYVSTGMSNKELTSTIRNNQVRKNLFEVDDDTLFGYVWSSGTQVLVYETLGMTGFIPVTAGKYYTTPTTNVYCLFYDADKNFLSRVERPTNFGYLAPTGAYYGKFVFIRADVDSFYVYEYGVEEYVINHEMVNEVTPYQFTHGVAFGTSLTERGKPNFGGGYTRHLQALGNMDIDNQGISSATIYNDGTHQNILSTVRNYTGYADKDFVILEGFVNDWYYNASVLGSYTDTNENSVCGCVRNALNYIMSEAPYATVILVLDNYGRNFNNADCSSTAKKNNLTQYQFYEEIAKVGESLGVPVIKLYELSGINEYTPDYLVDNIHPTAKGAEQVANTIWSVMKNIPIKVR